MVNDDVLNVITKMGGIMQERGYPLKNLQSALDELKNESAMDMVLTSKADGEIQEEDLDKLTHVAQADILASIAFTRQNVGPRQQVEFRVTSIDAATNKQISGETGRSSASGAPISALLEESVLGFDDRFVITTHIQILDISEIQTFPQKTIIEANIGVYVGDGLYGTLFSSYIMEAKGLGDDKDRAIAAVVRKIRLAKLKKTTKDRRRGSRSSSNKSSRHGRSLSRHGSTAFHGKWRQGYRKLSANTENGMHARTELYIAGALQISR